MASVEFHSVFSVVPNLDRVGVVYVLLTSGDPLKPGFPEESSVNIVPSLLFHLEFSYSNNIRCHTSIKGKMELRLRPQNIFNQETI